MAAKKTKKKTGKKKAAKKTAKKAVKAHGGPRKCGECGERGHNSRSHDPGGKLA
jgi:ribosomal protein L32